VICRWPIPASRNSPEKWTRRARRRRWSIGGRISPRCGRFRQCADGAFHLLEMLDAGAPRPALILAMPVGFVGRERIEEAAIADGAIRS